MEQPVYDLITIKGITAFGLHGVYPQEKTQGQHFSVDIVLEVDIRQAAATDDLYYTVDYSQVAKDVANILQGTPVNLLESLAETIARKVLDYPPVAAVNVHVHKPQAPLEVQFSDISLNIRRTKAWLAQNPLPKVTEVNLAQKPAEAVTAVIALGANLGDAPRTLAQTIINLDNTAEIAVTAVSGLFKTAPVLQPQQAPQPDYFNAVIEIKTTLSPLQLLANLHRLEAKAGRVRKTRWEARVLDLDILDYGQLHCETETLTLPHPRAHERAFVLQPWNQIDPQASVGRHGRVEVLVKQVLDQTVEQLAEEWVEAALAGAFSKPVAVVETPVPETKPRTLAPNKPLETPTEATVDTGSIRRTYLDTSETESESPIFAELAGKRARMQTEWLLTKHQIDREWEIRRFRIEKELKEAQERIAAARKNKPENVAPKISAAPELPKPRLRDYQQTPVAPVAPVIPEKIEAKPEPVNTPEEPRIFEVEAKKPTVEEPKPRIEVTKPVTEIQKPVAEAKPVPQQPDFEDLIHGIVPETPTQSRKMPSWKKVVTPPEPRIVEDQLNQAAQQQPADTEENAKTAAEQQTYFTENAETNSDPESTNFTSRLKRRQILRPAPTGATPVTPRNEEKTTDDFGFSPWTVTSLDALTDDE
ncbi:2-amino-4-hydroxy-6-hydroxymethyldihydropteridine diphosphokinase [Gleimia sp. 6138-11-ORH1]|uniref:2-amino-4-hydroxy-6- hydroxymethyldihydropteridine diphosphokinase n=1 Tax=Gleimia sp. 6138-11-ORH1 TaxID=2973937 RepID=UPI00216711C3|nr:2-amino-4-hydroxy-6-hydroxymethyldihydropteridine diphosphokinase [Gleimia sp. 6138-11-ORH1]MCS4484669.1 2-amino-4-hydroxy-6-hydroxymethyldihydropteridine diphosphokinase [Gleimia sp. 6138-11-ORH1]